MSTLAQHSLIDRVVKERKKIKIGRWLLLAIVAWGLWTNFKTPIEQKLDQFLIVQDLKVVGNSHYSSEEILTESGLVVEKDLIHRIDREQMRSKLNKLNYIEGVNISKNYLRRNVMIEISEREPIAIVKIYREKKPVFLIVDQKGFVLEYIDRSQLPCVIGNESDLADNSFTKQTKDVIDLLVSMQQRSVSELIAKIEWIDATHRDRVVLKMKNLPKVFLATDQLFNGVMQLRRLIAKTTIFEGVTDYVDLRFEESIYVREG